MVLYPSKSPVENACDAYAPDGAISAKFPSGETNARTTRIARKKRNSGFSTFPIHVRISPGLSEKNSTTPKKSRENTASPTVCPAPGRTRSIPTV